MVIQLDLTLLGDSPAKRECRKNQEKLTRVDNVLISKYQSISSPGWLSVSEVAYNFDQV